ncbi:MAG: methyl-accepting chemotaxis protein [Lachnospiraceae bacterium]|nr:methyl-accepting chemotaxis protein [Lachnospiraceae bacterium]
MFEEDKNVTTQPGNEEIAELFTPEEKKEMKIPVFLKEKKVKEPKAPKEKKVKEPKEPKEKKVKEPKPPKEKKVKEPKAPKEKKVKEPKEKKEGKKLDFSKAAGAVKSVKWSKLYDNKVVKFLSEKRGEMGKSIMGTLTTSAILPVIFMVIMGVVSYATASNALVSNTEESATATVVAVADYLGVICDNISSKAAELVSDSDIKNYYQKLYQNRGDTEAEDTLSAAKSTLGQAKISNKYMFSYSIIPLGGKIATSLTGALPDDHWALYEASVEGQAFAADKKLKSAWFGYHHFVDEYYYATSDKYGLAYFREFIQNDAMLVLDIDINVLTEMLMSMDTGEGSIKAIVAPDGREIGVMDGAEAAYTIDGVENSWFTGSKYFEKYKDSETAGAEEVTVGLKKYLYIYAPVEGTGIMLCALIPQDTLVADAQPIFWITVLVVLIAGVIALFNGISIANGIKRTLQGIISDSEKVEKGDLSVNFTVKRKDEFLQLANGLNNMLGGIRQLITDTSKFGEEVNVMSEELAENASDLKEAMDQVLIAVDEVSSGAQHQAEETENSNEKMQGLSDNLTIISDKTASMETMADAVMSSVEKGQEIVDILTDKADKTSALTKELSIEMEAVDKRTKEIEGFVQIINEIAGQTNLLSLNASIEAARAGEHGRGFSVVAEEIRKLADQSKESANKIKEIVGGITETTKRTSVAAKSTDDMMKEQMAALESTVTVFQEIRETTLGLVDNLRKTVDGMNRIMTEKVEVGDSLQNIAAISEEAAASVEEINATISEQVNMIIKLAEKADTLKGQMTDMNSSLEKFQL